MIATAVLVNGRPLSVVQARGIRRLVLDTLSGDTEPGDGKHEAARAIVANRSTALVDIADRSTVDRLMGALRRQLAPELDLTSRGRRYEDSTEAANVIGRDRGLVAPSTERRRVSAVRTVLNRAVRDELLTSNPLPTGREIRRTRHVAQVREVELDTVFELAEVRAIYDWVRRQPSPTRRYAAVYLLVGLAGPRPPSEIARLTIDDLTIPEEGWGEARVGGGTPAPGRRWTGTDRPHHDQQLKNAVTGITKRDVPLAPEVVMALRLHIEEFRPELVGDNRVFVSARGTPPSDDVLNDILRRACTALFAEDSPHRSATLYDLRHTAATTMLRSGMAVDVIARIMGHDPTVLLRIYAKVLRGDAARTRELMDAELARAERAAY